MTISLHRKCLRYGLGSCLVVVFATSTANAQKAPGSDPVFVEIQQALSAIPVRTIAERFEKYEISPEMEKSLSLSIGQRFAFGRVRGTHAKGTCARGTLSVPIVSHPFNVGIYAKETTYENVFARFANGGGQIQDDNIADERALSISIPLEGGLRQDISMNASPIFPIPSITAFNIITAFSQYTGEVTREVPDASLSKIQELAFGRLLSDKGVQASLIATYRLDPLVGRDVLVRQLGEKTQFELDRVRQLAAQVQRTVKTYRSLDYWTTTAFMLGPDHAIKIKAVPAKCGGDQADLTSEEKKSIEATVSASGPDFLQDDLSVSLSSGAELCFNFYAQVLSEEAVQEGDRKYVEDPTIAWTAAVSSKSIYLAHFQLNAESVMTSDECNDPVHAIDVNSNTLEAHKPIGRMNGLRAFGEKASRISRELRKLD